jgi:hypothetical protein
MTTDKLKLTTRIVLREQEYKFLPDESFPDRIYVNDIGARASIYKIQNIQSGTIHALKIFRPQYQHSYTKENFDYAQNTLSRIPALAWITQRFMINHADDGTLLRAKANAFLENAIVMPWLEFDKITDIRYLLKKGRLSLTQEDAFKIAQSFFESMHQLELLGIAHGDIASSNILIDARQCAVHIIDIEDFFHDSLVKPSGVIDGPGGSQGYRFSASFSSWDVMADRFASAVLIAELLTLHDTDIVSAVQDNRKETTFTQMELDLRHSADSDSLIRQIEAKLTAIDVQAGPLFRRAMSAQSLNRVPAITEWMQIFPKETDEDDGDEGDTEETNTGPTRVPYVRPATSNTPTLMVFLLDLSRSMWMYEVQTDDGTMQRIQLATGVIGKVIESLLSRCRVGRYEFANRYHIAIIGYHTKTANLLYNERMLPGGEDRETETFMRHGIAPINMWADLQDNVNNIGSDFTRGIAQKISLGPNNSDGETHSTQAFDYVYNLLNSVIADYKDCHPPYVMHITDGASNDEQDQVAAFKRITQLKTDYGNVLMSTVYIGPELFPKKQDDDFMYDWPGITDTTEFTGQRGGWANKLRSFSSRMPKPYTEAMRAEGYTSISDDSYLFFPGNEQSMLRLAINNAASTGK